MTDIDYQHGYFDGHGDGERRLSKSVAALLNDPSEELLRDLSSVAAHSIGKHSTIQDVAKVAAILKRLSELLPKEC